jgi:hypothetical protein
MNRTHVRRVTGFALLAVIALGSLGCVTTVGVGYGAPVYGGWGGATYGGHYLGGGPMWP